MPLVRPRKDQPACPVSKRLMPPKPVSVTKPSRLSVQAPRTQAIAGGTRITFVLELAGHTYELFYEVMGCPVMTPATPPAVTDGSSILAALLPLAMKRHWRLDLSTSVSPRLMQATATIQDMFALWEPDGDRVEITASGFTADAVTKAAGCGMFFSGGVDSFYTLLKNRSRITHLIFVIGFDVALENVRLIELITPEIQAMAHDLKLPLIIVRTNIRELGDPVLEWRMYHGAAMAGVAHLLAPTLGSVVVASSHNYSDLFPLGTHPLLDPLWSTESLEVIHDGAEATRFRKVAFIASDPIVQRRLRVCYRNKQNRYNCGGCEKCLRTMVTLHALGVLDRCATFPSTIDLKRLRRLRVGDDRKVLPFHRDNLHALLERNGDGRLIRAVRQAMKKPGLWRQLGKVFSRRSMNGLLRPLHPVRRNFHDTPPFGG